MNENIPNKIDDSALEGITGGAIFNASHMDGSDPNTPWEVIDDRTGDVVFKARTRDEAIAYAGAHGMQQNDIYWDQVLQLRGLK